jgi:hypothetical protein
MEKDFPLYLFPNLNFNNKNNDDGSDCEDDDDLSYQEPIEISINNSNIECKVHKYHSSHQFNDTTRLLPWNLPFKTSTSKGYDIYFDINNQQQQNSFYYYANCKSTRAKFYPHLFAKGFYYYYH